MIHIDWQVFTPWASLAGGLLVGAATALLLLGNGRIAGVSGIVAGALRLRPPFDAGRISFVGGLLAAPWVWRLVAPWPVGAVDVGPLALVAAGLLVGVGVRMGNGCTSGHGVCGLSRFSLRSAVNVLAFMGAGFATVFLLRHLVPA